jgi:hypothetical protein
MNGVCPFFRAAAGAGAVVTEERIFMFNSTATFSPPAYAAPSFFSTHFHSLKWENKRRAVVVMPIKYLSPTPPSTLLLFLSGVGADPLHSSSRALLFLSLQETLIKNQ